MSQELVNLSYLVESSLNDEEYVKMMIEMYIKNTPEYLENFKSLLDKNDLEELKRLAHKFKASVTIMGIAPVTTLIEGLERNIADNSGIDQLPHMIEEITTYCNESLGILQKVLDSGEPICK